MTELEKQIATALKNCTFLPGSFDKRFVRQLNPDKEMTEKGLKMMLDLLDKYRRQIPNYQNLKQRILLDYPPF
jgi:hypothetical protein